MKKLAFILLLAAGSLVTYAQSIDDIKDLIQNPGYDLLKAKAMIDKYQANAKNASKAEGYYYKGYIYNALSKADSLKVAGTDYKWDAFEAFKKYQQMDKNNVLMVLNSNAPLFDIYNNYFTLGANAYNASNYPDAFSNFKKALDVEDYITGKDFEYNGFKFPEFDTSLIQNTALAARQSKDTANALVYYKKISDAGLGGTQNYAAYTFPVEYYLYRKDSANFTEATAKGKKVYPTEDYWTVAEMEFISNSATSKDDLFAKYAALQKANPTNYTIGYNYSVELYNYIFANDDKTIKADNYKPVLGDVLKTTIAIKSTGDANLLMARYLYNSSFDNSDNAQKIKGTKPDDVKKKKALNDLATSQMNELIPYANAAADYYAGLPKLKPIDKGNYKSAYTMLISVYEAKKDAAKVAEYQKKMDGIQ
ncbi:hypothetical protein [Ferruginibacter albus]|uniref:hypothetical protein n=1 Tax=Ferruginibacter albus TaxID=2875540 RepID=UPI001CC3813F|nr:hypothetical protein [Ferruginibacter albus]UAY51039.1 hypothetical protein K9M53_10605 [Ferruginibacter albus]